MAAPDAVPSAGLRFASFHETLTEAQESACKDLIEEYWRMHYKNKGFPYEGVPSTPGWYLWDQVVGGIQRHEEATHPWDPSMPVTLARPESPSVPNTCLRHPCTRFTQDLPPSKCAVRKAKANKNKALPEVHRERRKGATAYLALQHKQGSDQFRFFWSDSAGKGCDPKYVMFADNPEYVALSQWAAIASHDHWSLIHYDTHNRRATIINVRTRLRRIELGDTSSAESRLPLLPYTSPRSLIRNHPSTTSELKSLIDAFERRSPPPDPFQTWHEGFKAQCSCYRRLFAEMLIRRNTQMENTTFL